MGAIADRSKEHLGSSDSAVIRVRRLWLQAIKDQHNGVAPLGVDRPVTYRVRATGFVIDKEWTGQRLPGLDHRSARLDRAAVHVTPTPEGSTPAMPWHMSARDANRN